MNLQHLRYLVTLARERHFRRAAELCFVTQPALSLAIRKLEDELGVAIFGTVQIWVPLRHGFSRLPVGHLG